MAQKSNHKILIGVGSLGLLVGIFLYVQALEDVNVQGRWSCLTTWSHEKEGVTVPCSAKLEISCTGDALSLVGVISIGDAQWTETSEGNCYASGQELYGTWTSVKTVPKNDAARQFEQKDLKGKSLSSASNKEQSNYRVRVTSLSETQLKFTNEKGLPVTCDRL